EARVRQLLQRCEGFPHLGRRVAQVAAYADIGWAPVLPAAGHGLFACGGRRRRGRRLPLPLFALPARPKLAALCSSFCVCTSVQKSAVSRSTSPISARSIIRS